MNNNENNIFEENITNENITSETNADLSNQMPTNGINQNNDINSINNQPVNNGIPQKYKLILTRKKSFVGGMVGFDIYIDNEKVGKIKNGQSVELEVTSGEHIISIHKNNPVSINITGDTTADVVVFGANNFGITNINGQGTESNNSINNNYIEKNNKKTNMTLIISIILPIVSLILFVLLKSYITPWVYGLVIGFAIVNMVGLKNFKDNEKYNSLLIKNIIAIIISILFAITTAYISINEVESFDELFNKNNDNSYISESDDDYDFDDETNDYNDNNSTNRTSSNKVDSKLNYTIPQEFKVVSEENTLFEYEYESDDMDDYCNINIEIMPSYYDSLGMNNYKEFFEYTINSKNIKTKTINGNDWYVNENNNKYNYGIEKNNTMYTITYEIDDDASGYCSSAKNNFENSLKF